MHRACRDRIEEELQRLIAGGEAMLFTGAGFSVDARDRDGRPLPDSQTNNIRWIRATLRDLAPG